MSGALDGIRVLDLTRAWAGPLATRLLGDMGAEIIKIEWLSARGIGLDFTSREQISNQLRKRKPGQLPPPLVRSAMFPNGDPGEHPWNRQGLFNKINRNKLGLTLDLTKPAGVDIFKKLVKISHAVIENYSPRVMGNLGIDYPALRELNPAIVFLSLPGYGTTGPFRDYVSWGPILEGASGLESLSGYPGLGPRKFGVAYPDPIGGLNAGLALMLGLWHARATGEGQFIDVSQREALTTLLGEAVLDYGMNKQLPPQKGNRHAWMSPHGCYRCKGDDKWIAIAVTSEEEWKSLCRVMGNPSWAKEGRFADPLERWNNQDELDTLIQAWTIGYEHYDLMARLQRAGIAAGAVLDSSEMVSDPHLRERNFFVSINQPDAGTFLFPGLPIRMSRTPCTTWRPCPTLGQHNEYILHDILGLSSEEIAELEQQQVIGSKPP